MLSGLHKICVLCNWCNFEWFTQYSAFCVIGAILRGLSNCQLFAIFFFCARFWENLAIDSILVQFSAFVFYALCVLLVQMLAVITVIRQDYHFPTFINYHSSLCSVFFFFPLYWWSKSLLTSHMDTIGSCVTRLCIPCCNDYYAFSSFNIHVEWCSVSGVKCCWSSLWY
jgi:hypothetical protein